MNLSKLFIFSPILLMALQAHAMQKRRPIPIVQNNYFVTGDLNITN